MRELSDKELYFALQYAKNQDEDNGRKILEQFQLDQPAFAQTILAVFPSVIAEQDQRMAYLFMDLCFDVICVFRHAFGTLPDQKTIGFDWLEKSAALIDTELQAMTTDKAMDTQIRRKLKDRFTQRMIESNAQTGLVNFLSEAIDDFVSENPVSNEALRMTKTMIFVVVQLFCSMYDQANKR